MAEINLRREIERALRVVWPGFATAHPALAVLCDLALVLDAAVERFVDDPDYQDALADAVAAGASEQQMTKLIRRLTKDWLEIVAKG